MSSFLTSLWDVPTHRTLSVSLPVLTTAKGSGRLQSQKWSSLLVAMRSS